VVKTVLYDWGGANLWLFHAINGVRGEAIDRLMLLGTFVGAHQGFPVYVGLILLAALIAVARARQNAPGPESVALIWLRVLSVFGLAFLLCSVVVATLKRVFDFPRPPLALPPDAVHIVGRPEFHYSLPSGHTAFATVIAAVVWPMLPRSGRIVAVLFVAWVALSRVSLGAHFPADVAAGAFVGIVSVLAVRAVVGRVIP
jgi:membrane-associated phospholipid phosphatase